MSSAGDPQLPVEAGRREEPMVLRQGTIALFDRGAGIVTVPLVGKWNRTSALLTTGITRFEPRTGIPLHSHNVEETVVITEGEAQVVIAGETFELAAGDVTWVPAGVPHFFRNRGEGRMSIYWAYGGRDVTRTITETGVTVEHLSEADRGGTRT
ncbi:cupin domain-containing protein [Microbacterium ulmi]|nr:mannose-6-phosphate isomerase-like protein (cupin superfamily) [Microbacterium ulmi]